MGKKTSMSESSGYSHKKISKNRDKKPQINKFLKPKVYITYSWKFKNLVQQLTGNINKRKSHVKPSHGKSIIPVSSPVHVPVPVMDNILGDHAYFHDVSFESSEESVPTSLETYNNSSGSCVQQHDLNVLESWLLETTTTADTYNYYDHHNMFGDNVYVPMMVQEDVSVYDYDLSFSYEDYSVQF